MSNKYFSAIDSYTVSVTSDTVLGSPLNKKKTASSIQNRIAALTKVIFSSLKEIAIFPIRFIGSKTKSSGYHSSMIKTLDATETLNYIKHAGVASAQHTCDNKWIKPFGLDLLNIREKFAGRSMPAGIELKEHCFYDKNTSLKATISIKGDELIVGFGALGSSNSLTDLTETEKKAVESKQYQYLTQNLLGLQPVIYEQADELFKIIQNYPEFKGKRISLSGQCFGGSLAQYVALKNQVPAVCFNTLAIGAGLQYAIGSEKLSQANDLITHISIQTDFVSDNRYLSIFDRALSFLGIRTAGNFGKRYDIPSAYPGNRQETHDYMMGSVMKHVGSDIRNTPEVLDKGQLDQAKAARP